MSAQPVASLTTQGFSIIRYPPQIQLAVRELSEIWVRFCALPQDYKNALVYENGAGYESATSGGRQDNKETFHIKRSEIARLTDVAEVNVDVPEVVLEFLYGSQALLDNHIGPFVTELAREVEKEHRKLDGFAEEVLEGFNGWTLRFLHYYPAKQGEIIAIPHVDKGGLTLHLHESSPGLQYLGWWGRWNDVEFGPDETIMFPSMQLQLRSEGDLFALCHQVKSLSRFRKDRYSMVCFVDLPRTPRYNKDVLGPLQKQKPGFNYRMPNLYFKDLFIPA